MSEASTAVRGRADSGVGFGGNVLAVTVKKRATLLVLTALLAIVDNSGTQQASPARKLYSRRG